MIRCSIPQSKCFSLSHICSLGVRSDSIFCKSFLNETFFSQARDSRIITSWSVNWQWSISFATTFKWVHGNWETNGREMP